MEIKAKSKFDYDSVAAITHLSVFKKRNPKKHFIISTIISAICVVSFKILMTLFYDFIFMELFAISILVLILEGYLYLILPRITYNALKKMKNTENEYIFNDNILNIFSKSAEYTGTAQIEYSLFVRAYETSEFFFLYQTNNQAFVVDKSTIENGTAEEIRNKLKSFIGNKYIVCKY